MNHLKKVQDIQKMIKDLMRYSMNDNSFLIIKENTQDLAYTREQIESQLEKVSKIHLIRLI